MVICTHYLARVYRKPTLGHFLQTFKSFRKCHFWRPCICLKSFLDGTVFAVAFFELWEWTWHPVSLHPKAWIFLNFKKFGFSLGDSGGTELERRYGDVRHWRPPFHTSPLVRKDPISSKRDSSQDLPPFEKIWKFWPLQPQILALKPQNLEIFSWQANSFRDKYQFTSPTLWKSAEIQAAHPYLKKKLSAPSPHPGLVGLVASGL